MQPPAPLLPCSHRLRALKTAPRLIDQEHNKNAAEAAECVRLRVYTSRASQNYIYQVTLKSLIGCCTEMCFYRKHKIWTVVSSSAWYLLDPIRGAKPVWESSITGQVISPRGDSHSSAYLQTFPHGVWTGSHEHRSNTNLIPSFKDRVTLLVAQIPWN